MEVVQGVIQLLQQGKVEELITEAVQGVMRLPQQDLPIEPITEVVQEVVQEMVQEVVQEMVQEVVQEVIHLPVSTVMINRTNKGDAYYVTFADVSGLSCWQFCVADPAKEEAWTILQLLLPQPITKAIAIAVGEGPFALLVGL